MITTITSNKGTDEIDLPENENDFYHSLSDYITKLDAPASVSVQNMYGSARYTLSIRSGTLFIQEGANTFCFADPGEKYHTVYLTCINGDKNNYKFYKISPVPGGMVRASYGRIGTVKGEMFGERSCDYPERMFWIKYQEKISKGYEDKTEFYITEQDENQALADVKSKPKTQTVSQELYDKLKAWAKQTVESTLGKVTITEAMVNESRKLLDMLYQTTSLDEFNAVLLKLLAVSPRKVWKVDDLLAKTSKDFAFIVQREEDLLHAMMVMVGSTSRITNNTDDDFSRLGIKVSLATKEQKDNVISMLSYSLRGKVKNVYRIKSPKQRKRFQDYLEREHLSKSDIRGFWHGSRNQNWLSIIENGLLLHPNAVITGKMFGNGIYFAPSSMKSWGYTNVGRWAGNGYANTVYMGLYATAYGTPLYTKQVKSYSATTIGKHNCVHAKAGECGLYNDEVIFYDEAAILLEYLVEFSV